MMILFALSGQKNQNGIQKPSQALFLGPRKSVESEEESLAADRDEHRPEEQEPFLVKRHGIIDNLQSMVNHSRDNNNENIVQASQDTCSTDPPDGDNSNNKKSNNLLGKVATAVSSQLLYPDLADTRSLLYKTVETSTKGLDMVEHLFQSLLTTKKENKTPPKQKKTKTKSSHGGKGGVESIEEIVASVRDGTEQGGLEDTASLTEIFDIMDNYGDLLKTTLIGCLENVELNKISPTALYYYLEREDERKNPSWKRRIHRFLPSAGVENIEQLNSVLGLAQLCYFDTVDEVREGLEQAGYEMVFLDLVSEPGKPAHFIAVQIDQPVAHKNDLSVLVGIRGTKTLADAVTDLLCEPTDYRGGKAHGFLVNCAQYLTERHTPLLEELLERSGKSKIVMSLTGHSLGAGVASIAGIEFNKHPQIEAYVYGFGSPPSLSLELAKETHTFITTIVSDADLVPRLSAASVANLILSVSAFHWQEYAKRDVDRALSALHNRQPILFNNSVINTLSGLVMRLLDFDSEWHLKTHPHESQIQQLDMELYPPGRIVHFFRNGEGITGSIVPNDFFTEIDVSRSMIRGK
jgi:hypothetical protein